MTPLVRWAPAVLLALGATFTVGVDTQRTLSLRAPLGDVVPEELSGFTSRDVTVSDAELRVADVSEYLMRNYELAPTEPDSAGNRWFSVYIGYYDRQTQGRTIHSPKNCLPGGGWEPLASQREMLSTAAGEVPVNRYLLRNGDQYALVLYWYQGRGRVESNEYVVKWDLLRDSALRQRSEEALGRIVVPVTDGEDAAFALASDVAAEVIPALFRALPR